ncbi:MAG: SusE domain-containing protein [Sphingobacteriales bacterium]|nr:SusE domain-containing protein [Sphingobacteriales bacterium]
MKNFIKYISLALAAVAVFGSCQKKADPLPFYGSGKDVTLQVSSTSVKPAPSDANKPVLNLSWSDPGFATDTSNYKYVLEFAASGSNFANPVAYTVMTQRAYSLIGNDINNILAGLGVPVNGSKDLDVRMKASYANNNDMKISNVLKVTATAYGVPITLTPSSTNAIVLDVKNATNKAVGFSWTESPYGTNVISYALQIAVSGTNFANPQTIKYDGALNSGSGLTVNELNNLAIAAGVSGGSSKNLDFRVVSSIGTSYSNFMVYSNIVTINVTTFTPVPPALYIVGDATPGGWDNPVPVPSQQFSRLDDVSYGIIINLTAGKSYLLLPVNGDWSHKYGGASATGGQLLADDAVPGSNTPSPATSGTYKIVVNFQTGTYTVTPVTTTIPDNLFIVGDATEGGWSNPVPVPSQQFTRVDAVTFGLITKLNAGGSYLLLPENGSWSQKYAVVNSSANPSGDVFGYYSDAAPSQYNTNFAAPSTTGMYQILVNFATGKYTVTPYTGVIPVPQNLFIVGDATPGGWDNPVPVPSQRFTRLNLTRFQLKLALNPGKSYLLLPVNGDWSHKYGGASAMSGDILVDNAVPESNTPSPDAAGTYLIDVNFATGKYTLTKQ